MQNLICALFQQTAEIDKIANLFTHFFGGINWLVVVFMSMIPIIELKGGILWGMSNGGLNGLGAGFFGILGCMVSSIFVVFALKPILDWLKRTRFFKKIISRIEKSFTKKAKQFEEVSKVNEKTSNITKIVILMSLLTLFIAIPIPLSGVWTGCSVGIFIGLKRWQVFVSSLIGCTISALILILLGSLLGKWTHILFYIMLGLAATMFAIMAIKITIDILQERKREKIATCSVQDREDGEDNNINRSEHIEKRDN